MENINKFLEMQKEFGNLRKKASEEVADYVWSKIGEFPDKIEGVGWHQYIPGFNDGDPCTFCANLDDLYIRIKGVDINPAFDGYEESFEQADIDEEEWEEWTKFLEGEEVQKFLDNFSSILGSAGESLLEYTWGSDKTIMFLKNKEVETEYYDCGY